MLAMTTVTAASTFDSSVFWDALSSPDGAFWKALSTTVLISVVAQLMGVVLGLLSALAGASRLAPLRFINFIYVTLMRGTPLLVQIVLIYFTLPAVIGFDLFPDSMSILGIAVSGTIVGGIFALGLNEGAYMSEIFRAGLGSVDPGQRESAISLGMTERQAFRRIVLPQAARVIVPPLGNEFNNMMKNSALVSVIGVSELFLYAQQQAAPTYTQAEHYAAIAVAYLLLTLVWTAMQTMIERSLDPAGRAAA